MSSDAKLGRRRLLIGASVMAAAAGASRTSALASTVEGAKDPDLSGKSILVTGSSSGFGRLGVEHYARLGAKVFATMRNLPRAEADELRGLARKDGLDVEVIEIDVTSDDQVARGVAEAERRAGGAIDVLVNNAGVAFGAPIEVADMAATKLIFDTNVYGPHRMARAVLPAMRAKGRGQIIQISSQLGRVMIPGFGQYSPTKFALEAMSEQMAYELVPHGVDVTIVQPGGYPTRIWANANAISGELKKRTDDERLAAYPALTGGMGAGGGGGGETDPMDVPRAIAALIAAPAGARPLRRPVHPGPKPQLGVNEASARAQLDWLGGSSYGPWIRAVHGVEN